MFELQVHNDNLNKRKTKMIKEEEEQPYKKQCENFLWEHYRYNIVRRA